MCSGTVGERRLDFARQRLLPLKVRPHKSHYFNADRIRGILNGTHEIAQFYVPDRPEPMSLHADIDAAKDSISKIRMLEKEHGFHVALAHDAEWLKQGLMRY